VSTRKQTGPSKIFRQENRFSDLSHRLSSLTALFLHHLVGVFFVQGQITLQNALRTVNCLPRLKSAGKLRLLSFQSRPLDLRTYKKSQSREQPHLFIRKPVYTPGKCPGNCRARRHRNSASRTSPLVARLEDAPRYCSRGRHDRRGWRSRRRHPAKSAWTIQAAHGFIPRGLPALRSTCRRGALCHANRSPLLDAFLDSSGGPRHRCWDTRRVYRLRID
jgi:hypothetical protein